jgi:iron complex outermembrane receptor protein
MTNPHVHAACSRHWKKIALASLGLIAAAPAPLLAAGSLEEIIVTARKTEERSQLVPISLTAISADELEKKGSSDFRDLAKGNPNVKINEAGSGSVIGTTIAIRGNIQNDATFQTDPAVGTYVDGLLISRTFAMSGSLVDVESVQTLKGPQGTLFGRNTTGGALVIQTRNPEQELGGYIRAELGSYNLQHATGVLNVPLSDRVALRLVADVSKRDPYAEQTDGREFGDADSSTYRGKLAIEPTDTLSILLSAESVDVHGTSTTNVATQPNNPQYDDIPAIISPAGFPMPLTFSNEKNLAKATTYSVTATQQIDDAELKFIAGRRTLEVRINQSLPPLVGSTVQDKPDNDQNSIELQYNTPLLSDSLQLTSGLYYFDEDTQERQYTANIAPVGFTQTRASIGNADTSTKSVSAYMQGIYTVTDALDVIVGGRYTRDSRDMPGEYAGDVGDPVPMDYSDDNSKFNYLLSVDYKIDADKMIYASTSTGYRAGSAGIAPDTTRPGYWQQIEPETITNYEIGAKTEWLDKTLRINIAAYRQDYQDYQSASISVLGNSLVRGYDNYDAEISGAELEVSAALFDATRVGLTYGYTDAKIDKGNTPGQDPRAFSGRGLPNIPDYNYSLFIEQGYEIAAGTLELRADYSYQASFYSQLKSPAESTIDEIGLLNLSATYSLDNWKLSAYVKNATDEEYYSYINYLSLPNGLTVLNVASLGMPRTAGVSAQFNF